MMKTSCTGLALIVALVALPSAARAQCENPVLAGATMQALMAAQTVHINQYTQQEISYLDKDLKETATKEVMDRFDQFRNNILDALNAYAERLMPEMRDMSKQLSTSEVDQTRQLGSFEDARLQTETQRRQKALETRVARESDQSTSACVLDTVAQGQSRGYRIGRAVARGLSYDAQRELGGARGTVGARGPAAVLVAREKEFEEKFCNKDMGDQGCSRQGPLAGRNNDLAGMLWGDRRTLDMNTPENVAVLETVTRNIAGPLPPEPMDAQEVRSAAGIEENLRQRARRARINTIYNAIGQMAGQRVGGTGTDTQDIRAATGTPRENASTDASYNEIREAIARDRFSDPDYLFSMVNNPAGLVRELGAINAVRMMQVSDLYKRMEELVWVEGAVLGAMLDDRMPN